jgi:uncharacterized membrane protein (DUF2068 family)
MQHVQKLRMPRQFDNVHGAKRADSVFPTMSRTLTTEARTAHRRSHRAGLRMVAFIEALKGLLALLLAFWFIRMLRRDVDFEDVAEHLLHFLHIGRQHHLSQQFLNAADKLSDTHVATVLGLAVAYATLRFLEGYGLWRQRVWAEWLAIVSGCIYLPIEIYKLIRHPNEFHWIVLLTNVVVVLYIAWVRWDEIKAARSRQVQTGSTGG